MKQNAREFIRSTTTLLDHVLAKLTQEEQHEPSPFGLILLK